VEETRLDLRAEAKQLVHNLSQRMSPSAYDVAWMARVSVEDGDGARWPDLIEWLLNQQWLDGSWGGVVRYYHDRILCTLAAIIALRENGYTSQVQQAIKYGEEYLWHNLHRMPHDPFELSGFELLLPTLLTEARELGLGVPDHAYGYEGIRANKLRLIPADQLYSPRVSTVYSLEFLGQSGDPGRMLQAVNYSGSLGNSPATTAYLCIRLGADVDEHILGYLETLRELDRIVTVYPFSVFELGWVLNNLCLGGLPIAQFDKELHTLHTRLSPTGAALDPSFGISDGDITAVCCHVLLRGGYEVDPQILARFEDKDTHIFRTYEYERNVSMSTNIHALAALGLMGDDYPNRGARQHVVSALLDNRVYGTYWTDKWHASAYYATSHALVTLAHPSILSSPLVPVYRRAVDWLIHTQRKDGSWGFFEQGTVEETAYALIALLHCLEVAPVDKGVLQQGAIYLTQECQEQKGEPTYPELWLAKSLYSPYDIVHSAVLAAMLLYDSRFGWPPE
jgi:halimadienyl-diphosphate synthase